MHCMRYTCTCVHADLLFMCANMQRLHNEDLLFVRFKGFEKFMSLRMRTLTLDRTWGCGIWFGVKSGTKPSDERPAGTLNMLLWRLRLL